MIISSYSSDNTYKIFLLHDGKRLFSCFSSFVATLHLEYYMFTLNELIFNTTHYVLRDLIDNPRLCQLRI